MAVFIVIILFFSFPFKRINISNWSIQMHLNNFII